MGQAAADCLPSIAPSVLPSHTRVPLLLGFSTFLPSTADRARVRACVQASERAFVRSSVSPLHKRLGIHLVSFFFKSVFFKNKLANFSTTGDKIIVTCECYKGFFF